MEDFLNNLYSHAHPFVELKKRVPNASGIYVLMGSDGRQVLYVGRSKYLTRRLESHRSGKPYTPHFFAAFECPPTYLAEYEEWAINQLRPIFNISLKHQAGAYDREKAKARCALYRQRRMWKPAELLADVRGHFCPV